MSDEEFQQDVDDISDQLTQVLHQQFNFRVETNSTDIRLQKLAMMCNFLLESASQQKELFEQQQQHNLEAAQQRLLRFERVLKGASVALFEIDLQRHYIQISGDPQITDKLKIYNNSLFHIDEWISQIHPHDRQRVRHLIDEQLTGETPYLDFEYRMLSHDGGYRYIQAHGIGDAPQGTPPNIVAGVLIDQSQIHYFNHPSMLPNREYFRDIFSGQQVATQPTHCIVICFSNIYSILEQLTEDQINQFYQQLNHYLQSQKLANEQLFALGHGQYLMMATQPHLTELEQRCQQLQQSLQQCITLNEQPIWLKYHIAGIDVTAQRLHHADEVISAAQLVLRSLSRKNQYSYALYDHAFQQDAKHRQAIEQLLRMAIKRDQVTLFLQPVVSLIKQAIVGYEALVRIQHPTLGIISPEQFIPVAEETGLIEPLSQIIFDQAIALFNHPTLVALHPNKDHAIAINLSPTLLSQHQLPEQLSAQLKQAEIAPHRLKIEVTESTVMENTQSATELLKRFRDKQMDVALDDFGTGYSALAYLTKLPFSRLKLDRQIVADVTTSPSQAAIVEMVMMFAKKLGLATVVEGIETTEQLEFIRALGGELAQGFLFSRPCPVTEMTKAHEHIAHLW